MKVKRVRKVILDDPVPVYDALNVGKYHNFLVKGNSCNLVVHNCAFLDEMNFYTKGGRAANSNENFMKMEVMKVYSAVKRRMESRFMMYGGTVPGKIFMVSSKKAEDDALEQYAASVRHSPSVSIVDEPQWVVKNVPGRYCGKMFKIVVGDKYENTRIISDGEDVQALVDSGKKLLDVPIEHYEAFALDPDQALTDIAGIALVSGSKYIDANRYRACVNKNRRNGFKIDVINVGLVTTPHVKIQDYFDLSLFSEEDRHKAWYIHWDASKSGDRTGLGLVCTTDTVKEVTRVVDGQPTNVTDRIYQVGAAVGIQAISGDEVPFSKIREFIYWLRVQGFRIVKVTMDSYQSVSSLQDFVENGLDAGLLSLDRSPKGYQAIRSCINEGRIELFDSNIIETEFTELTEDKRSGKVDHPLSGSKDIADGITGALYDAVTTVDKAGSVSKVIADELSRMIAAQLGESDFDDSYSTNISRGNSGMFDDFDDMM